MKRGGDIDLEDFQVVEDGDRDDDEYRFNSRDWSLSFADEFLQISFNEYSYLRFLKVSGGGILLDVVLRHWKNKLSLVGGQVLHEFSVPDLLAVAFKYLLE